MFARIRYNKGFNLMCDYGMRKSNVSIKCVTNGGKKIRVISLK